MKNHALGSEEHKSLKILDKWLIDNMYNTGALGGEDLVMKLRETITKIEERGYYTDLERELLNEEFSSLTTEVGRIAKSTKFNGRSLLGSETTDLTFKVTAEGGDDAG